MNYIELINHYWQLREQGIVSGAEGDLYLYLLHTSNRLGWKNPFNQSNRLICAFLNISEKSLIKYKNVLKEEGLIDFDPGNAVKQNSSYTLLLLDDCNNSSSSDSSSEKKPGSNCKNSSRSGGSPGGSLNSSPGSSLNSGSGSSCKNSSSSDSSSGSGLNSSPGSRLNSSSGGSSFSLHKTRLNKTKQNNSLSLSPEAEEREKERERILFLEYLFFEKRILTPADEVGRFEAHYAKTDWKDANGNRITNKLAALKGWKVADGLQAVHKSFSEKWRAIYDAAKGETEKSVLMITDLSGYEISGNSLKISVTDNLRKFIDDPDTITAIKPVFRQVFPGLTLEYVIIKKN